MSSCPGRRASPPEMRLPGHIAMDLPGTTCEPSRSGTSGLGGRNSVTTMPGPGRTRPPYLLAVSRTRRVASVLALMIMIIGLAAGRAIPARAASVMTVLVTSNPRTVATGQAMAYTITAANTGGADASGLTMTDTITDLVPASPQTAPFFTQSTGSCSYNASTSQVTCTAATLPAGQVWTVTITAQMTAAAGTALPDTATVTGTESGATFSGSGSTTTTISPSLPAGFAQTQLAHGLAKPVVIAFAPNGDIWIGEQGGAIVTYRNGAIQPTPVVTLSNVYSQGENGGGLDGAVAV